jgi:hypothetical protein
MRIHASFEPHMEIFWNVVISFWPVGGILIFIFIFSSSVALFSVFAFQEGRRRLPAPMSVSGWLGLGLLVLVTRFNSPNVLIAAAALLGLGGYGGLGGLLIGTAYREGGIPGWYRWPLSAGCLLIAGVLLRLVVHLG